ncbi:DUF2336 domain-containing protein [Kiloniella sp. b19]|uniref:DUF2336 domain-containing protein n=1 Tax=Kiloniella sp. GXU_MW_B19 TaxID=3141326 RepID=UPI0031E0DB6F
MNEKFKGTEFEIKTGQPVSEEEVARYKSSKDVILKGSEKDRIALARNSDIEAEVLFFLAAEDDSAAVREAVASNVNTPAQAGLLLASDKDESVRQALAEKVAKLAPELDHTSQKKAQNYLTKTLEVLIRDEATRVKAVLAEALKESSTVPAEMIQALVDDENDDVACPILKYSPLLSDEDLIAMIYRGLGSSRLSAVSGRKGLGEAVTDAIVQTEDRDAIAVLLGNSSAQIREETLDLLVDQAENVPEWHVPLVQRPNLSVLSLKRVTSFIAEEYLSLVEKKVQALDPESAAEVSSTLKTRLDQVVSSQKETSLEEVDTSRDDDLRAELVRLLEKGKLDEARVQAFLDEGERDSVIIALAVLSGLDNVPVRRMIMTHSPKVVVALVWRSGLSMAFAEQVQQRIAGISPGAVLVAEEDGEFPLPATEMEWQVMIYADEQTEG